jgi:uncharacterized protein with ParB-like and HNH nuclease domain
MKGIQNTASSTYRQLMGNGLKYEIPKFQRDYTWEEEQWGDLWLDIKMLLSKTEEEHYMGYLVLQTSDNKNFRVIDGQQRLTTLSLLVLTVLKRLEELAETGAEPDQNTRRKETLQNSYIGYTDPVTLIAKNKLTLNRNTDSYYRNYIVLLKDLPVRGINASEKQLRNCFRWFYKMVKEEFATGEDLAKFIEVLADRIFFTVIQVTDELNAFKVFETLNARGVQLSASDLLKNHLFTVVDEEGHDKNELGELEEFWGKITGKLGSETFEEYLRYYWNSYNRTVRKNALFKSIKEEITTKAKAFQLVRDLDETVDLYLALQNPNDEFWSEKPKAKEALWELQLFGIRQTNSLFIAGYKNLSKEKFEKLVSLCAVISFRYNVIGGLNPNEQEDIYNRVALKVKNEKRFDVSDLKSIYITDEAFESNFAAKPFRNTKRNHKIVKYILTKIEKNKYANDIDPESDFYSIEHILPESADESWGEFTKEEINRSVYRLGNLTLLERKLNQEAGIKPYSEKKKIFEQSNVKLTQAIPEHYETWSETKIDSRQKGLAKLAKSVWQIQEMK